MDASGPRPKDKRKITWRTFLNGLLLIFLIEVYLVPSFFASDDNPFAFYLISKIDQFFGYADHTGYTLVDIDNDTFSDWQKNGRTDRSKIKELISLIASDKHNKPKAIVVDIDLSVSNLDKNGGIDEISNPNLQRCPKDRARYPTGNLTPEQILAFYVCQYAKNKDNAPLIFVQSLRRRPKSSEQDPLVAVPLIFEKPKEGGPVYFATSGFLRNVDGNVRSWLLAEPVCKNDQLTTIPSVELLLLPIKGKLKPGFVNQTVQTAYSGNCLSVKTIMHEIRLGEGPPIRLSPRHLRDRIVYTMKMPTEQVKDRSTISTLAYRKAKDLNFDQLDHNELTEGNNLFSDRIVVIGGSNEESRDIYNTPYGVMPGVFILINAIESLRNYHQLKELQEVIEIIGGILIGVITWYLLKTLDLKAGVSLSLLLFSGVVICSILLLYYYRVWFGVSGIGGGTIAHFVIELIIDLWRYLCQRLRNWSPKRLRNWFRASPAKGS
jgi:hypothetical protein